MKKIVSSVFILICFTVGLTHVAQAQPKTSLKYYNDWRDCIVNVLKERISYSPYQDINPIEISKDDLDQNENDFEAVNGNGYRFTIVLKTKVITALVPRTGQRQYRCELDYKSDESYFAIMNINDSVIYDENLRNSQIKSVNPEVDPKNPDIARTWAYEKETCAFKLIEKQIALSPFLDLKITKIEVPFLLPFHTGIVEYKAKDSAGNQFTGGIEMSWSTYRQEEALSGEKSYRYYICELQNNEVLSTKFSDASDFYNFYIQNTAGDIIFYRNKPSRPYSAERDYSFGRF